MTALQSKDDRSPAGSSSRGPALNIICRWRRRVSRWMDRSLLTRIVVVLALAVGTLVCLYTYLLFRVQGRWNQDRAKAIEVVATLSVSQQYLRSLVTDMDGVVRHPPRILDKISGINRQWVIDRQMKVLASDQPSDLDTIWEPRTAKDRVVSMLPVSNLSECRSCHVSEGETLARVIVEYPDIYSSSGNQDRLWMMFYGVAMMLLAVMGLTYFMIHYVQQPLSDMVALMGEVQTGNLSVRYRRVGNDEISRLGMSFNRMIRSLSQTRDSLKTSHQRQLQQAEKLASVGELASGLAHEIRNPLAGIKTAVQVITEKIAALTCKSPEEKAELLEISEEVGRQSDRVRRLIGNLLQYVRPRDPRAEPCDLGELVERILYLVRPQARKLGLNVKVDFPQGQYVICADAEQIQQALLNICLNGLQAMKEDGWLSLFMEIDPAVHEVVLSISDSGAGIKPEVRDRIFSPFFTTKPGGTGLGLSITKAIIERHGGRLLFNSKAGEGTTFIIRLPLLKEEPHCSNHGGTLERDCQTCSQSGSVTSHAEAAVSSGLHGGKEV